MDGLTRRELEALCEGRPALERELQRVEAAWKLPPSTGDVWIMEKSLLLLAKYRPDLYKVIMSTPPRNGTDKVTTWLFDTAAIPGRNAGGRPQKYGEEARERARSLRADGFSIRAIAKEMDCSTFTVQRLLK